LKLAGEVMIGKITVCLLVALITLVSCARGLYTYTFDDYASEFKKQYSSSEAEYRKAIFESNLEAIRTHNANPSASWKMGVNHLTDQTDEEFRQLLGYKKVFNQKLPHMSEYIPTTKNADVPASIDWREKGIITPVKDQGQCGSCWTFGTAEVIESYYALVTGQLATLSEQQILDCVPNPDQCGGTGGCGGGTPELAFEKLIEMGGLTSEWMYPYTSYFGTNYPCHYQANTTMAVAVLSSYVKLPSNQYEPVMDALQRGPLVINIDASAWRSYQSGVFTGCNQTNSDIDHVVLLVGYGTDPKEGDYWLIRNSWTPAWGEGGYIRLARSSTVQCTPDTAPQDGTGCNGGPSVVTVCGACGILYDVSYPILA